MQTAAICGGGEAASVLRYAHHLATAVRSGPAADDCHPSSLSSLDGVGGSKLR
jgi:hypothetical protein